MLIRFLDTMSLHIVVNGMTSGQRMRKQKKDEAVDIDLGDLETTKPKWLNETSLNNLNDVYQVFSALKGHPPNLCCLPSYLVSWNAF